MTNKDDYIRGSLDSVNVRDALIEFGETVHPIVLGDEEGYIAKAKEFLRANLCPAPCEVLADKKFESLVETASMIADVLHTVVMGVKPEVSAVVVWKVSSALAKFGLPNVLGCAECPLKAELSE